MTVQVVGQIIQFILAPVVMISATGLLLLGLLGRYAAVNDRIRLITHERFDLLRALAHAPDPFERERLVEIDAQLPPLTARLRRLHDSVLTLYLSVAIFVVSMFLIGLAAAIGSATLAELALLVFLAATAIVLLGLVFAVLEVRAAQNAVEFEVRRVMALEDRVSARGEDRS